MDKLRLFIIASLAAVSLSCATWKDYEESRGAGKPDGEVAIFKAHLENTHRIISAPDKRIEYQYDPAPTPTLGFSAHQRVRLLPGQYTITARTWPFGSLVEFEVDLKAGHKYQVETALCSLECIAAGKPYRHDRWIQDLTTHERISGVVSECYLAKPRQGKRWRVPCPDEENPRDVRIAGTIGETGANGENDAPDLSAADSTKAEAFAGEDGNRNARDAGRSLTVAATDIGDSRDTASNGAGKAGAKLALYKADLDYTRRIVSALDGSTEYQYNPEMMRTFRSAPHTLVELPPGQYTISVETWPFGSLYDFAVDLKAGHTYGVETHLCSLKCILNGEPYRHDRWIQDLTSGERITGVVSECYLGKKRRRERQKVPCPD